ncbi:MAG TPA: lysylphosphatidylglycerol synthase transmembrane domain-containing protein [Anaerolineales bacterium]|nr:lysylphosphatidylglycerol synthase transmembrane domain-containing protein [Anaerolineales bacterium]HLO29628.1 lysylphosphatidylglycerol synthase transmembrane domain-containing protein [Anaerolineales bacterium]
MSSWWSRNRQFILQLTGTLLAIVLLLWTVKKEEGTGILAAMREIKLADLLWVALLFAISRIAIAWRWQVLLLSGGIRIRFRDTLALNFMGLFAGNFLPTTIGGDVVRLVGLMQMGFDRAISLASLAADRLIGMAGMAMTVPIGVVDAWNVLQNVPFSISFLARFHKPVAFFRRTLSVFSIWFRKPVSLLAAFAFTWIHMLCLFGSIYILVDDLGTHASFWMIAGLWSLTYFITLIPISINGYGVQELVFTFLLSNIVGFAPAVAASIALLIRGYFLLSSLPGAIFLPAILSALAKQKAAISSPEPLL